jgi:hypothetical protein
VLLQQPIAFTVSGVPWAILMPVVAMLVLPSVLGVSLVGLIVGIAGHLGALPLDFSRLLARRVRTESLGFDTRIGHKAAPTMSTATLAIHGFLLYEAVDLQRGLVQEE